MELIPILFHFVFVLFNETVESQQASVNSFFVLRLQGGWDVLAHELGPAFRVVKTRYCSDAPAKLFDNRLLLRFEHAADDVFADLLFFSVRNNAPLEALNADFVCVGLISELPVVLYLGAKLHCGCE